jgi:hypothetical protein
LQRSLGLASSQGLFQSRADACDVRIERITIGPPAHEKPES